MLCERLNCNSKMQRTLVLKDSKLFSVKLKEFYQPQRLKYSGQYFGTLPGWKEL
jgi:hypothetical protein